MCRFSFCFRALFGVVFQHGGFVVAHHFQILHGAFGSSYRIATGVPILRAMRRAELGREQHDPGQTVFRMGQQHFQPAHLPARIR